MMIAVTMRALAAFVRDAPPPHLVLAAFAFARLIFITPVVPAPSPQSPRLSILLIYAVSVATSLLFLAAATRFAWLTVALFALRFAFSVPSSLAAAPSWRRLCWRVELPLFWLLLAAHRVFTCVATAVAIRVSDVLVFVVAACITSLFVENLLYRACFQTASSFSPFSLLRVAFCERLPSAPCVGEVPPDVYRASLFSLFAFQWVSPLIAVAVTRPLSHSDVLPLRPSLRAHLTSQQLKCNTHSSQPSSLTMLHAMRAAFGRPLLLAALPKFASELCNMAAPMLLRLIIHFLQQQAPSTSRGLYLGACLFALNMFATLLAQQFFLRVYQIKVALHGALIHNVFKKTLRLSPLERAKYEAGHIQNLMSTDCAAVSNVTLLVNEVWAAVLQVAVSLVLLVHLLGYIPTLSTFVLVLFCVPVQSYVVKRTTALTKRVSQLTDRRVNVISELIKGIKLVKLYAWEIPFLRRVDAIRQRELAELRSVHFLNVCNFMLTSGLSTALTVVAFASYVALGRPLDAAVVFPAIALFDIMWPALLLFPKIIVDMAKSVSSMSRLQQFLSAHEVVDASEAHLDPAPRSAEGEHVYQFRDTTFSWGNSDTSASLHTGTFSIPHGSLVAVVGSTAGGKSTLMAGMLGELQLSSGHFSSHPSRKVSFCHQVPFIQNATVRENILFGKTYNEQLYKTTISVCCLLPDLHTLPAGDATEIGSRGVNLSGGQRARVALARAVYNDPDICLMDDPLSAVDANVGRHLFEKCIAFQLKGKTRILATNHLHFASSRHVDMVIVLHNGRVVESGRRLKLMLDQNSQFSKLLDKCGAIPIENQAVNTGTDITSEHKQQSSGSVEEGHDSHRAAPKHQTQSLPVDERLKLLHDPQNVDYGTIEAGKLIKKETKEEGRVKMEHLQTYLSSMGVLQWVLPIALFKAMELVARAGFDVWMSLWSEGFDRASIPWHMFVFILLGMCTVLFGGVSVFCLACGSLQASLKMHRRLILSVIRAPISFFDSTPEGRLMNRFNSDIDRIDTKIGGRVLDVFRLFVLITIRFGMLIWAIPWFVCIILLVSFMLWVIQEYFRKATVDLRRLESLSYSPLYSHFAETIDGVATIRAFKDSERMIHLNSNHTDLMLKTTFATAYGRRWLSMRMNTVGCLLTLITTVALMNYPSSRISPSMKGLLLSYVVGVVRMMRWTIKSATDLESQLSSMERISEYTNDSFPREELYPSVVLSWSHSDRKRKQESSAFDGSPAEVVPLKHVRCPIEKIWPEKGRIVFDRVSMRYRWDMKPALKNVSLRIEGGEHIGIVGRTGAGKSTIIHTLFRLHKLMEGCIRIDGVDICSLSLQELRSRIGIIPQEPICFSGTIRSNLDMLDRHPESNVRRAFEMCGLARSIKAGLDYRVKEGGATLSVGQRQMMCLGRALLRQCKIVVLDEATSSVSAEIDSYIQETIRKEMHGCTVLTVAHRLDTVMHCDRVMVMQNGEVAEFGRPRDLLASRSLLGDLVDETGLESAAQLRRLAGVHPLPTVSPGALHTVLNKLETPS